MAIETFLLVSWILGLGVYHTTREVFSIEFFFFFIESLSKNQIPAEANIGSLT